MTDKITDNKTDNTAKKIRIARVKIRPYSPAETFITELPVKKGDWVAVNKEHGIEVGNIIERPFNISISGKCNIPLIERIASKEEIDAYWENLEREKKAWKFCEERARHYGLSMKLVRVERQFEGQKIIFYYVAENRVDFRELVKDLVRGLKNRIEMRQIGVRHEAKMVGGIGCCGREVCCANFIREFAPVSIKMAKVQNLPLNPNKISGICGRLLCCLSYEYETYKGLQAELPSLGKSIEIEMGGEGKVIRQNVLKGTVTVLMPDGDEIELYIGEDGEAAMPYQQEAEDRRLDNDNRGKDDNLRIDEETAEGHEDGDNKDDGNNGNRKDHNKNRSGNQDNETGNAQGDGAKKEQSKERPRGQKKKRGRRRKGAKKGGG